MARRNARKRLRQPARAYHVGSSGNYYGKRGNWNNIPTIIPFPKSMRPSERFFGSILSSSVTSFQESETAEKGAHQKIMHHACSLLDVPALPVKPRMAAPQLGDDSRTHHLTQRSCSFLGKVASYSSTSSGTFENARSYYLSKAPLILEESRCIIAEALLKLPLHNRQRSRAKSSNSSSFGTTFPLDLLSVDEKYPNKVMHRGCSPIVLNFQIVNGFGKNSSSFHARQQQRRNFHVGDLKWTRPGSVVVLRQCQEQISTDKSNNDSPDNLPFTVLACVQPQPRMKDTGEEGFSSNSFLSLMIFRKDDLNFDAFLQNSTHDMDIKCSTKFEAIPLTTLISQVRQMEACLRLIKVPFMPKLLGRKDATHIRFDDSSSDEEEIIVDDMDPDVGDDGPNGEGLSEDEEGSTSIATEIGDDDDGDYDGGNASISRLLSSLPTLNKTQERAAQKFLNSPPSSLILVQGPPGTGKTTFLVNTIFRRLASDSTARILVTAPTNKAVTVLAQRFLDVINNINGRTCHYYNAVLVGVEDKLISDSSSKDDAEFLSADSLPSSLRSIFVYTWVETIKNECTSIFKSLQILHAVKQQKAQTSDSTIDALVERSSKIESQLFKSIPSVYSSCKHAKLLAQKIKATVAAELWESSLANISSDDMHCNSSFSLLDGAIHHAESLIESLDEIDSYNIIGELLATARVIFCTLSTAGASIMKQTHQIDDLLVDEAAAATEPEIWIPFHLHPKRMLAVGDPDQLPPTIVSRFAADMGLSKSMHERLMHECGEEYFMLVSFCLCMPGLLLS